MTVLEKANQKRDAAERGMSYGLPGYGRSHLQWWTAYIEGAEDQKREGAEAVGQLIAKYDERAKEAARFDIRQLPEGFYTIKDGVVYTARGRVPGGNILNLKTGESHWEDDQIVGGEQVFPRPEMPLWDSTTKYQPGTKVMYHGEEHIIGETLGIET